MFYCNLVGKILSGDSRTVKAKKNIIVITAMVSALTSGCSLNNKSKEEIHTEVYNTYSTFNDIKLEDNNGEYIPFVYIANRFLAGWALKYLFVFMGAVTVFGIQYYIVKK